MPDLSASTLSYRISPPVANEELNYLFAAAWPDHGWTDFALSSPTAWHTSAPTRTKPLWAS